MTRNGDKDERTKDPKVPLEAKVERDAIVIRVGRDTVKFATENHPTFWNPETDTYSLRVADPDEWLRSVVLHINDEREDGSSLLSDLFDKAIEAAAEQGE